MTMEEAQAMIDKDLEALDNDPLLTAVANYWERIYLDPSYILNDADTSDPLCLKITAPSKHAFVVMGFALKNGRMVKELELRCDAAAKIASVYPEAIIVCTGGKSGEKNGENNTEAGLMREYLIEKCGISALRIFTDEESRATNQNVTNTIRILREQGIRSMTVVTSAYHQRWATMLFCAATEQIRYSEDPGEIEVIGNWCIDVPPPSGYNDLNAQIASVQLKRLFEN